MCKQKKSGPQEQPRGGSGGSLGGVGGHRDVTGEEQGEMLTWQKAKGQMRNGSTGRSAIKWG